MIYYHVKIVMKKGMIYIVSAPSGAGKSSLIQALFKERALCNTYLSISHTTRKPRPGEIHSKHYYFISNNKFKTMIDQNEFLEHAVVFGNYYGTSHKSISKILENGIDVIVDIDWQGAQQIRKKMLYSRSIFILPPSKDELNRRLHRRGKDNEKIIKERMEQAILEMSHYLEYDYLIINDDFNIALNNFKAIIFAERLRINSQKKRYDDLITKLLIN